MAQQCRFAIREDGCPATPSLADAQVSQGEDLSMQWVKPPSVDPFLNGSYRYAERDKLAPSDDSVLSLGKSCNLPSHAGVSEFSHDMSWLSSDTPPVLPFGKAFGRRIGEAGALLGSLAMAADTASAPASQPGIVSHEKKPPCGRVHCVPAGIARSSAASSRSHFRR